MLKNIKIKVLIFFFLFFVIASVAQANVVLKVLVVNPSDAEMQVMPVKVFLPKEVKPENVIDKADLSIAYDTQQGSYYVYGEYKLAPSEVVEREVEIEDIWIVSTSEIESLRNEADKLNDLLKGTEFADRINFIYNTIMNKLDGIGETQLSAKPNPEDHISQYRVHLKLVDSIKTDLAVARSMLDKAKPISTGAIWKMMIMVLVILGIIALSFYFFWFKQASSFNDEVKTTPQASQPEEEFGQVRGGDSKEEDTPSDDIEKMIRGE